MSDRQQGDAAGVRNINLDPLTDLVANTVGIVLFALILAMLSAQQTSFSWFTPPGELASGAAKSDSAPATTGLPFNPIMTATAKERVAFLCKGSMLYPLALDELQERLMEGHRFTSFQDFPDFVRRLNQRQVDDGILAATAAADWTEKTEGSRSTRSYRRLVMSLAPVPGATGDRAAGVSHPASLLHRALARYDKNRKWLCFFVEPDSVEVFKAAREESWRLGFQVGWEPIVVNWPIGVNLLSSGKSAAFPIAPQTSVGKSPK